MAAQKVAPSLAAGCAVILKLAEQTPLTALELARALAEAGLPPGALNVLTGFGDAGAALVAHPAVVRVSFTGSVEVGKDISRSAADTLKRVTLELGGKSPNLVFADADFEAAMAGTAAGIFANQGEICSAGSRVLVDRAIYDDALDALAREASDPARERARPRHHHGPAHLRRAPGASERLHRLGRDELAARLPGRAPDDPALADGFFVPPTIFADVDASIDIARGEIFGPVMAVTAFADRTRRSGSPTTPATAWRRRCGPRT